MVCWFAHSLLKVNPICQETAVMVRFNLALEVDFSREVDSPKSWDVAEQRWHYSSSLLLPSGCYLDVMQSAILFSRKALRCQKGV